MKLAIFDMDGTILDSMGLWLNAGELYLKTLGITAEKDLGKKLFELNMEEGAEYMKEKYHLPFSVPELCDGINKVLSDAYENSLKLKPGALEFLTMLKKKGIKTALCTNTSDQLFEKAFDRLKINELFDFEMYTGKFNFSKSNPKSVTHFTILSCSGLDQQSNELPRAVCLSLINSLPNGVMIKP